MESSATINSTLGFTINPMVKHISDYKLADCKNEIKILDVYHRCNIFWTLHVV